MVPQDSLLVMLVTLVDRLPMPALPAKRGRGHPKVYPDRLFSKALVLMIVRHLHNVHELLSVLSQPTEEMRRLRALLCEQGRFPASRTWERLESRPRHPACTDWLSGSPSDRPDRALGHVWACGRYR
jgi:hypothetical protein